MRVVARTPGRVGLESDVALIAVAVVGCGSVLALAGLARRDLGFAVAGGTAAGIGLVWLLAARPAVGLLLVALSLPLPALYQTGSLRVSLAAPITALAVAAWGLGLADPSRRVRTGALPIAAKLALLTAFGLGTAFAVDLPVALRETLNFGLLIALLVAATDIAGRDRAGALRLVPALIAIGAVCGALAVLEAVGVIAGEFARAGTAFNRAALGFGQPNGLGLFLAVLQPLAVCRIGDARGRGRVLAWAVALLIALGLVATFSRGAWLAVLGGSVALLLVGERRLFARVWVAALLLAIVLDITSGGALRATARNTIGDWVIEQRVALMAAGVMMFLLHPWTGVGPGGFETSLDRIGAQIPALSDYLPTPHNAYIQMAAETGIVGLAALLAFFAVVLRTLVRRARAAPPSERALRAAILWSLASTAVAGLVIWPFAHGTGQAVLLILALGLADPDGEIGTERGR